MTRSDAAKKLRRMFGDLGAPPKPEAAMGNLAVKQRAPRARSDRTEQLNTRVPLWLKRRVRLLATRDDISLAEVIIRSVALYEEKHGKAPEV